MRMRRPTLTTGRKYMDTKGVDNDTNLQIQGGFKFDIEVTL